MISYSKPRRLAINAVAWLYRRLSMPAPGTIIVNSQGTAWIV